LGRPLPLTDTQKREVVRLRAMGRQYKQIARTLGCTPDQARRWVRVHRDDGVAERAQARKSRRITRGVKKLLANKPLPSDLTMAEQAAIAKRTLAAEIAQAREASASETAYKPGDLVW
jgi:transposase-like protein